VLFSKKDIFVDVKLCRFCNEAIVRIVYLLTLDFMV